MCDEHNFITKVKKKQQDSYINQFYCTDLLFLTIKLNVLYTNKDIKH